MRAPLARSVALALAVSLSAMAAGLSTARAGVDAGAGANADANTAADALIRRGVELRRAGKDQEALEEFRKAYAQVKTPRALAQVALAEQALGRWVAAEADLDAALASKADPWIGKNGKVLSGAMEVIRRHLGSLDVIGPAGAELRVDGQIAGTLPLKKPARVPIGSPVVELRQPGFFPGTRPVSITAGELTRESIDLQPVPAVAPTRGPPPSSAPARPPADSADRVDDAVGGGWRRPLAWTTAVGAVLAAGGGVAALLVRSDKIGDANRVPCNVMMNGTVSPPDPADNGHCLDLAGTASRAGVAAIVSFSAAGVFAIASGILFATAPSRAATASGLACAPTPATTGVACQLRF